MSSRHWYRGFVALLCILMIAGCSLDPIDRPGRPTAVVSPTPRISGGTLTVRIAADITTLRPWQPRNRGEEQLVSLLYASLIRLDERLRPEADLATSWIISGDGRTITLALRKDVVWHDGRAFSADDVAYTIRALQALPAATALLQDIRRITTIESPDPNTVVLSLDEPYAPILSALAVPILPMHLLSGINLDTHDFWATPVGCGPFRLEARTPDVSISLLSHARYHRGAPLLERVALIVAPDPTVAAAAFREQRLLVAELPWSALPDVGVGAAEVRQGAYPENSYYFLAFNLRENRLFADLRVRQALARSIDVPTIVAAVTDRRGVVITSGAAPRSWADVSPVGPPAVDLEAARQLLDAAGWLAPTPDAVRERDGAPLGARLFVRGDDPARVRAAELIAAAARQVGFAIEVERADFATTIRGLLVPPYDFDLLLGNWSNGMGDPAFSDYQYYDPDDYLLFHSSQADPSPASGLVSLNIAGFRDREYDAFATTARRAYNTAERIQALAAIQRRIREELPYLYLWADRIPVVLNRRVTSLDGPPVVQSPQYFRNVERWYIDATAVDAQQP
jgi:peptide/nickel transport system substrate-binding protein